MSDERDQSRRQQPDQFGRSGPPFPLPVDPAAPVATDSSRQGHISTDDLVSFAMQFVEGEQASAISEHITLCADCREELALIQGDLAAFAFTTDLESPSPSARKRFLTQIAQEKKVIPISKQPQTAPSAEPLESAQPALASFGRGSSFLNQYEEEARPKRNVGLAILAGLGWAVAAGVAFFAFTLYKEGASLRGTLASRSSEVQRLTAEAATSHQLMDALTDPKAIRVSLTAKPLPKPAPIGGVTYNPDKGTLVFLATNLDPLQLYKTYELWVIPSDGSAPIPAGTFHPDEQGNASVIMPDLPKGIAAKSFGVTVEDDGGAAAPTLPIVLAGGLG
jgi:Anti-sigma-K factor rskA